MNKPKASRLKVFQAQFGFYDSVVAATSQPAALRAWGTHQNLFAEGQARVTTDEAAVKAALAHPDTPLRRPVGSTDTFQVEPTGLPIVPDVPKPAPSGRKATPTKPKTPPKPTPDRSKLEAAERAIVELEARREEQEEGFQARQHDLDLEIAEAKSQYAADRKSATANVASARKAYRDAGGED